MLYAFLAAIFAAAGIVVTKIILKNKANLRLFLNALFLFLFLETALLAPRYAFFDSSKVNGLSLFYFAFLIIAALVWNLLYYRAMQKESVVEFETISSAAPLLTIVLAAMLFADERHWLVVVAGVLAGLGLMFSQWRGEHLRFSRQDKILLLAILFMAVESQLQKIVLGFISPVGLYFVRTALIFLLLQFIYPVRWREGNLRLYGAIALSAACGVGQMTLTFTSISKIGIVTTSLILMLAPLLIYLMSWLYFKEKMRWQEIVGATVILGAIAIASLK